MHHSLSLWPRWSQNFQWRKETLNRNSDIRHQRRLLFGGRAPFQKINRHFYSQKEFVCSFLWYKVRITLFLRPSSLKILSPFFTVLVGEVLKLYNFVQIVWCGFLTYVLLDELVQFRLWNFQRIIWVIILFAGPIFSYDGIFVDRPTKMSVWVD